MATDRSIEEFRTARAAIEFREAGNCVIDPSDGETEMSVSAIVEWFYVGDTYDEWLADTEGVS